MQLSSMALVERNLPLSKSRSRTLVNNKKLTLSTTLSDLKSVKSFSNENQVPSQPMIKEPVLMQPKRTLSKCKAKIDLKTIDTSQETATLPKSRSTLKISQLDSNKQTNTPVLKGLSKSRTAAKLVNEEIKPITELGPPPKTLSKSRTSAKLIPTLDIFSKSRASSVLLGHESDKKTLSKTATSVKLQSVGEIDIVETKDEKKNLSKHSSSTSTKMVAPRRRSSRVSIKFQPLEVFSSGVDINIDNVCDPSSSTEKLTDCKKNENIGEVSANNLSQAVPEKSRLSKSKTVSKLKNTHNALVTKPSTFRKTRSQSLMQKNLIPTFVPDIEIDEKTLNTEENVKTDNEPTICETPKIDKQGSTERQKRLLFTDVNVYYFDRTPGHCSVPRDGFNTIGMEMRHSHHEHLRFNLGKDIIVRRKLFGAKGMKPTNDTNSFVSDRKKEEGDLTNPFLLQNSKRRLSQGTLEAQSSSSTSAVIVSPSKLQKSKDNLPSDDGNPVVRKIDLDDCGTQNPPTTPGFVAAKTSSTLLSNMLRRNAEQSSKKLPKTLSTVHFESPNTPGGPRSSLKKYQSCVSVSAQHPAFSDEFYNSPVLSPAMRGSPSPDNAHARKESARGECGTRGLTPLSTKARASLLRSHGVFLVDRNEAESIQTIRESRETCGCSCRDICTPESCECALNDIECQIERSGFPCSCGPGCQNPNGRKVFDASEVSMHYLNTMMTVKAVL